MPPELQKAHRDNDRAVMKAYGVDITNTSESDCVAALMKMYQELKNYGNVLEQVSEGSPVYLTKNGRGAYSIRTMQDEEDFEKAEAMIQLMCELNAGIRSVEEDGWISYDDLRKHIHNRRLKN